MYPSIWRYVSNLADFGSTKAGLILDNYDQVLNVCPFGNKLQCVHKIWNCSSWQWRNNNTCTMSIHDDWNWKWLKKLIICVWIEEIKYLLEYLCAFVSLVAPVRRNGFIFIAIEWCNVSSGASLQMPFFLDIYCCVFGHSFHYENLMCVWFYVAIADIELGTKQLFRILNLVYCNIFSEISTVRNYMYANICIV